MSIDQQDSPISRMLKIHREDVIVPKQFLDALLYSQIFEQTLEIILSGFIQVTNQELQKVGIKYDPKIPKTIGLEGIIQRIKVFLPESELSAFNTAIKDAQKKRNRFVHECFKVKIGPSEIVNLSMDDFYKHADSIKVMNDWIASYFKSIKVTSNLMSQYLKDAKVKLL